MEPYISLLPVYLQRLRERLQGALEDAQRVGDGKAVVGDRHAVLPGANDAAEHSSSVPHAGAAMDDQLVIVDILREILPLEVVEV